MLQTDCVGKSKPTKQSWEGVGCRASHPLLTAKDGAPSVVLGYWGRKVGHPPIANTYTYDSFGKLIASTGSVVNPYRYSGRELDTETGIYYYRARYYDPTVGRFLNEDPVHFQAGTNFYAYVMNDPIILSDPSGLCSTSDFTNAYWSGGGSPVDLGSMGLGGAFEGAPSVADAVGE